MWGNHGGIKANYATAIYISPCIHNETASTQANTDIVILGTTEHMIFKEHLVKTDGMFLFDWPIREINSSTTCLIFFFCYFNQINYIERYVNFF